ncbi:MAG: hypothetical protein ACNA8N_12880 [Trueperaceae bacterium]
MPHGVLDILYVSGSLGLGHVQRDLGVARALRARCPRIDIRWIAGSPAREALLAAGERLAPEASDYRCETDVAEATARAGRLNLTTYTYRALAAWFHNARLIGRAARRGGYAAVVGDETYEILVANFFGLRVLPPVPFVMMYDFLGMESTTHGAAERLGAWALNLIWSQEWRVTRRGRNAALFFGELEDVPERRFGWLLPPRRRYAQGHIGFVGYVLPFPQDEAPARDAWRRQLGYGDEPLVVCSVGGTSVGRELLELCGRAFPLAAQRAPGLRMVVVAGPRIDPEALDLPAGVERRGNVDALWRHFAAADLAVVQAGGTTTLELEVLRTPFLYFPVEGHAEQEVTVAGRLARHGAGVRMRASTTSPAALADAIVTHLGEHVSYPPVVADGAQRAAALVLERLGAERPGCT